METSLASPASASKMRLSKKQMYIIGAVAVCGIAAAGLACFIAYNSGKKNKKCPYTPAATSKYVYYPGLNFLHKGDLMTIAVDNVTDMAETINKFKVVADNIPEVQCFEKHNNNIYMKSEVMPLPWSSYTTNTPDGTFVKQEYDPQAAESWVYFEKADLTGVKPMTHFDNITDVEAYREFAEAQEGCVAYTLNGDLYEEPLPSPTTWILTGKGMYVKREYIPEPY